MGRDINLFRQGRTYTFGLAGTFWAFGVNLWAGRLYSLLGLCFAAALTFLIGKKLYGSQIGILAALSFLVSIKAFLTSHLIRPETWITAAYLFSLYAQIIAIRSKQPIVIMLAGIIAVMPVDIHGHGIIFSISALITMFWELGLRQRTFKGFVFYLSGLSIGGILWILLHIWPSPSIAWLQIKDALGFTIFSSTSNGSILSPFLSIPKYIYDSYWVAGNFLGLTELGLGMLGLIVAMRHHTLADRLIGATTVFSLIGFTVLFSQRFANYALLWAPLFYLLGFAAIERLLRRETKLSDRVENTSLLISIGTLIILSNLAGNMWLAYRYQENNFSEISKKMRSLIPENARVLGDQTWWWGLQQTHTLIPDEYFLYPLPYEKDANLNAEGRVKDYIAYLRPNYILIDSSIACAMDVGGPGWIELEEFAKNECKVVGTIDGAWWGDTGKSTNIVGQRTIVYQCKP